MGLDQDAKNPSLQLILGLALTLTPEDQTTNRSPSNKVVADHEPNPTQPRKLYPEAEPSLTLGLSGESYPQKVVKVNKNKVFYGEDGLDLSTTQTSPHCSTVSSFSSGKVKRERDHGSEEVDTAEIDEDGATAARKKLRLTKEQSAMLEESFKQHSTLNPKQKQALARQLNLRPRQVEVWFQNRRARTKLKQTEVDCDFLKKCCETLTDENMRLQKELQELKALKTQPLYMPMPAATLTMCPSCERLGGVSGGGASNKIPFSMASKPHFFNPFTNPSAAC
ncbi:homeobox-leucine zipper protein HAT22-like isoform X2 [Lotus japonicus]|uniref:Homeobox domain-containing protein n=1 Tax=Lotus japonicus TaxID=34305 RepID=I3S0E4_LOTJA|nr:homeobox-leucine zipper protein HAT22-like isoform X2 [Lotus japonicus]AFK33736.1 unknown [Lotus japonicus]